MGASVLVVRYTCFTSLLCLLLEFEVFVKLDYTEGGFEAACAVNVTKKWGYARAGAQEEGYGEGVVAQFEDECSSGVRVVWACEEVVEDRFAESIAAVWTERGVSAFDAVQDLVQGYMACPQLGDQAGLVAA